MDISGNAVRVAADVPSPPRAPRYAQLEQHLLTHRQQSTRVVHIGVILARPQRVDIQPREELHELQFAPGQDGDPSKLAPTYKSGTCCPQSTARRLTVAPSGSWTSTTSPWLRDDSNATSYDVYLGKRRQPTNKVLTTLRVKFVKFVPGRGEPLLRSTTRTQEAKASSECGFRRQQCCISTLR
ncbi:hypothetical protein PF004_g24577 [Phytophthora fragariae]|uniref:Uncharacterized protein n=1 Tax=Phytophthora fragariae TaxID=53985 RepID=A0A6G0MUJ5_9STRA|nr:hypothetical protein PF004_g24577 [Phytophthora fragariae]